MFCTRLQNGKLTISKKNKKNTPEKVELKKFCARCNASTLSQRKEIIFYI
ncbi:50S ribosomal protein L33 [Mycoplasmopsis bovis]|nr:50S ribosomal protein L33 [Mycoplasmopsis bovis]QQH27927.1 50S ribosomal protein L33 [Mycoplasmopsis bovis]